MQRIVFICKLAFQASVDVRVHKKVPQSVYDYVRHI